MSDLGPAKPAASDQDDGGGGARLRDKVPTPKEEHPLRFYDDTRYDDESALGNLTLPPEQKQHLEDFDSSFVRPEEQHGQGDESRNWADNEQEQDSSFEQNGNTERGVLDELPELPSSETGELDSQRRHQRSSSSQQNPDLDRVKMPPPEIPASKTRPQRTMQHANDGSPSSPQEDQQGNLNLLSSDTDTTSRDYPPSPSPPKRPAYRSNASIGRASGKILHSRYSSQRSSVSSIQSVLPDDESEPHEEEEEDRKTIRGEKGSLSRTTSLGSIASSVTSLTRNERSASISAAERALARLNEEEQLEDSERGANEENVDRDILKTPTRAATPSKMPTDTAIAIRIRDVEVPPTVAKDLRSRYIPDARTPGPRSPTKRLLHTPHTGAAGKHMTLKEQSNTIDKLQKENFDLKIKVYYLQEKLEKQSDEGVQEMMNENLGLKIKLTNLTRDWKQVRKMNHDLSQELEKLNNGGPSEEVTREIEELKSVITEYEEQIIEYREKEKRWEEESRAAGDREAMRDAEVKRINEVVKGIGSSASSVGGRGVANEEIALLRELLNNETQRADNLVNENKRLKDEIWKVGRPTSNAGISDFGGSDVGAVNTYLKNENEDLRQKLAAQTAMLTSRNRERERLVAEIEELKLHLRSIGGSFDGLSNYDRTASRLSGMSTAVGQHSANGHLAEQERDEYENLTNALRDRVSELKLKLQEAEQTIIEFRNALDTSERERFALEDDFASFEQQARAIEMEKNEVLQERDELENEFHQLKSEAEQEIANLEEIIDNKIAEVEHLTDLLHEREEGFEELQNQLRNVSDMVVSLEDQQHENQETVARLNEEIAELKNTIEMNEQELNALEKNIVEANGKVERGNVQMESLKSEVRFLREEQDSDKMKIGELERETKRLETALQEEKDERKEVETRLEEERRIREETSEMKEQELTTRLNEKETELLDAKNEIRKLTKNFNKRTEEAKEWRDKLQEFETSLREALGGLSGTRESIVKHIIKITRELENTLAELEDTKAELTEQQKIVKDRDSLLEGMALESRRLNEALDKERASGKQAKLQLEALQNTHHNAKSTLAQQQKHAAELEKQRQKEARALAALEERFKAELAERNNLLLTLWLRVSKLCGPEWTTRNSLANAAPTTPGGQNAAYSMESAVVTAFSGFSKNLMAALKAIESVVGGFKARVRNVERDLWKEYQVVETALESRTRRLERLEALVRGGVMNGTPGSRGGDGEEGNRLKTENRLLKAEIAVLKREKEMQGTDKPSLNRSQSDAVAIHREQNNASAQSSTHHSQALMSPAMMGSNQEHERRWILRLKELERRLKQEREARILDRDGAKRKLEEERRLNSELARQVEILRERAGLQGAINTPLRLSQKITRKDSFLEAAAKLSSPQPSASTSTTSGPATITPSASVPNFRAHRPKRPTPPRTSSLLGTTAKGLARARSLMGQVDGAEGGDGTGEVRTESRMSVDKEEGGVSILTGEPGPLLPPRA